MQPSGRWVIAPRPELPDLEQSDSTTMQPPGVRRMIEAAAAETGGSHW